LQEAQAQVKVVAEQLLAAQAKNSQLASEIDTLKTQIANQTKLNQDDRLARQSAESQVSAMQTQLQGETTKRKAAEAKLAAAQGLADRVPQLEASLKSSQEALAKERGLSAQLSSAAEQYRDAADKAITDIRAAEAARNKAASEMPSRSGPTGTSTGSPLTQLGVGAKAGDVRTLTVKGIPGTLSLVSAGYVQDGQSDNGEGQIWRREPSLGHVDSRDSG
jgi:hypothetical protein